MSTLTVPTAADSVSRSNTHADASLLPHTELDMTSAAHSDPVLHHSATDHCATATTLGWGDAAAQLEDNRRRWEALFDPEYTFEMDEIRGCRPNRRKSLRKCIDRLSASTLSFRPIPIPYSPPTEPMLPRLDHLRMHIASHLLGPTDGQAITLTTAANSNTNVTTATSTVPIGGLDGCPPGMASPNMVVGGELDILPCPSDAWHEGDEKYKQRVDLFNIIRNEGLRHHHDGTHQPKPSSTAERLQQRLREKANKIKRDVHESDDDLDDDVNDEQEFGVKKAPDKKKCRRSFIYFCLGFIFPPVWLVGALYSPSLQSTHAQRADMLWRRRSRNAFLIFLILVAVVLILAIVFKPGSIGWRNSSGNGIQTSIG